MIKEITKIKDLYYNDTSYEVIRKNEKMKHPHIIAVHGSYAYGTNHEDSDIDIRAVSGLDRIHALGVVPDWETKTFSETDTVIYSYKKFFTMLAKGNPDAIGIVGNAPEDYIFLSKEGKELVDHHTDLLGARNLYNNFIGYANAQLRRLELAELGRLIDKKEIIKEKKMSILDNATINMQNKYGTVQKDNLRVDFLVPESSDDKVIVKDFQCQNLSIDDFFDVAKDFKHIVDSFGKAGKRNTKKNDFKLNKHCMHLVRGMLMGIETLETGKVRTYRENDLPFLKDILNGCYMDDNGKVVPEFYKLVETLRKKADYAFRNTVLPIETDLSKVADMMEIFLSADLRI